MDDDASDGRRPSVTVCIMYDSFDCHYSPMDYHIRRNIWLIGSHNAGGGGDTSFTDCMKIHNGSNFLKYPVGLIVRVWLTANEQGFKNFCPDNALACASRPRQLSTPRRSVDGLMYLTSGAANSWGVVRHEMAHTYGYNHCDMTRIDRLAHCIVGRSTGTNVPMNSDGTCPAGFPDKDEDLRLCCKRGDFDGSAHTIE